RVCSGVFKRNHKCHHVRQNKPYRSSNPTAFMAQEKSVIDSAYPGDIIGLHDTGNLKIGDTLTEGKVFTFKGIPSFSPEIFKLAVNTDPMKTKQFLKGLEQLCEEGISQLFSRPHDPRKIVGTVGALQFEVIQYRLEHEYSASCQFEALKTMRACWLSSDDPGVLQQFIDARRNNIAIDKDDRYVYLADTQWSLDREIQENPDIVFSFTSE
ncbi:MAG: peptide chain release factor 3, partial [Candidatus Margulisbacteria bacterium]|nr:peptide chain release factor 3 [Candidatus Margulisiibacteriota bacterium]